MNKDDQQTLAEAFGRIANAVSDVISGIVKAFTKPSMKKAILAALYAEYNDTPKWKIIKRAKLRKSINQWEDYNENS